MKELNKQLQTRFVEMCNTGKLFKSSITGQQVWTEYLNGFTKENDPIFRDPNSSTHNCNNCHNFVKRYGNIIAIDTSGNIMTIWDNVTVKEFKNSASNISEMLQIFKIQDVFFETFDELNSLPYEKCSKNNAQFQLGINVNYKQYTLEESLKFGVVNTKDVYTFNHLHLFLPKQFVDITGKSIEAIMAEYRDAKNVFQRAMEEIPLDTLNLVKDLIIQGSLLDGQTHLYKVEQFIPLKQQYDAATNKDNWCWVNSYKLPFAKFKNELIGVLCSELAEGKELNEACQAWNKRVDPANYMKATAPITKKQIEEAKKFVEENGYEESFNRRFATIDDIKVSEIKHINSGDDSVKKVSVFDNVKAPSTQHKRSEFDKVEEVSIEKFMKDVLPNCTSVEAFLENRMSGNLVTMTTSANSNSKPMFKWSNNYSWTFNGNLAGKSQLTQMVEAKGGRTDGVLRCTHSWNELEPNQSLMDAHVFMPGCQFNDNLQNHFTLSGNRVGWNCRQNAKSGGVQDVDYIVAAPTGYVPVENITFPDVTRMPEGVYTYRIHNWSFRKSGGRGKAEIAFEGNVYQYEYPATKQGEWITVAEITLKNGRFSIKHCLPETSISKEMWNLESNKFHKVNLMCLSPNHWDDNKVGNLHYFFILDKCKVDTSIRGFHNENLTEDLLKHRKVMEVLGACTMIEPSDKQLSGLGFNATVRDEVVLRLSGSHKRVIKVKF